MSSSDVTGLPTLNGSTGPGRPTKRTKKAVAEILDAISAGAPIGIACSAAGIGAQTFQEWRRRDPALALEVDQAAARGTVGRLKEIGAQGRDGAWQALSWLVERRHPAEFAKPEIALNVGIQNNLNAQGGNGGSFETLVVTDLEFLGLRQREGYQHRPAEREAREVEAEIVPEDLSGTLTVATHPGSAVISKSQQEENERRTERSRKKIEALLQARRSGSSEPAPEPSENGSEPEESSELEPGMIIMPIGLATASWWKQFCEGDISRLVSQEAANWACRELSGTTRIQFDSDAPIAEVIGALQRVVGPNARQLLLEKAGMA